MKFKFLQDKDKRETLERVAGLLLLVAIGLAVALFLNANSEAKKIKMVSKSTECYSVEVPASYKVNVIAKNCQLAAYTGESVKESTNLILMIPYDTKITTQQEAADQLQKESPKSTAYKRAKIGGKPAIFIEGESKGFTSTKYNRFYLAYDLGPYKPSGKDFTSTSIRLGFTIDPNQKDIIQDVRDSVRWK